VRRGPFGVDIQYFRIYGNIEEKIMPTLEPEKIANFADMLAALGAEPRLRIVRLLLQAHPDGLVVG
jgi:hypothetical protein